MEFGNFDLKIGDPELEAILNFNDPEFDSLISDVKVEASDNTMGREMLQSLSMPLDTDLPPPETPSTPNEPSKKRFKTVSEDHIKKYESMNQSESTKRNTKWGMKILQDWHKETYGNLLEMESIAVGDLAKRLTQFYCEAKPQEVERKDAETTNMTNEYHKNTLKNIRGAINRHLSDIGREIDIVNDKEFKHANNTLNGLLKEKMALGTSLPTQHKEIIPKPDLDKISSYLINNAYKNPVSLRLSMWYNISFHFVTRGLEFHHQLRRNSFEFKTDEYGNEYVSLNHETQAKNYQGGISCKESTVDKRMYATGTSSCPVNMLKFFLSKTDENASSLFNQCVKDAITSPESHNTWFTSKSLGKFTFRNFMPDLCKQAGCTKRYTAHCLRATSIQSMSNAGFETRQIMFMSGHRNEASVRSYSRDFSTCQKKSLSSVLSATASASHSENASISACSASPAIFPRSDLITPSSITNAQVDITNTLSSIKSGIFSNSTFSNCSFNFNMKM